MTVTKFDPAMYGRETRTVGSAEARSAWETAERLNAALPGDGEWIPVSTVWVREDIQPREIDWEAVERYAMHFDALPPIRVQRGTFALIGGRHRLHAAGRASRDHIRAVEVDVHDDAMAIAAFEDNLANALPYRTEDRVRGLKLILASEPAISVNDLARRTGLSWETAKKYANRVANPTASQTENSTTRGNVVGSDGRITPARHNMPPAAPLPPVKPQAGVAIGAFRAGDLVRDLVHRRQCYVLGHKGDGYTRIEIEGTGEVLNVPTHGDQRWSLVTEGARPSAPEPVVELAAEREAEPDDGYEDEPFVDEETPDVGQGYAGTEFAPEEWPEIVASFVRDGFHATIRRQWMASPTHRARTIAEWQAWAHTEIDRIAQVETRGN